MIYKDIWDSLEGSASTHATGYIMRRIKPESVCGLFLAIKQPSHQHMLQITLSTMPERVIANIPTVRGLDVSVTPSEQGFIIQLMLRDSRFEKVFDSLIDDIIEVTSLTQSEAGTISAFVARLRHWQKFLEQIGPDGLNREKQQGLYGELWFLRECLIPLIGLHAAINAWKGPSGAAQDFQVQSCAIEVKTTGTKEPQQIIIQSERQLDDTSLAALFLYHLSIDVREGSGETLPTIVNSVRQLLEQDALSTEIYEDLLIDVGFLSAEATMYEKNRYRVRKESIFHVRDTFPRIIEFDLKPGVGAVKYSIMTSACQNFLTTREEFKRQLIGQ